MRQHRQPVRQKDSDKIYVPFSSINLVSRSCSGSPWVFVLDLGYLYPSLGTDKNDEVWDYHIQRYLKPREEGPRIECVRTRSPTSLRTTSTSSTSRSGTSGFTPLSRLSAPPHSRCSLTTNIVGRSKECSWTEYRVG